MPCAGLESGIQQRLVWGKRWCQDDWQWCYQNIVKVPIAQVWAGGMIYSLQEHQRNHESSARGRKENNAARGASGGWEGAPCSQVFGDWPHSAAMEVWVGGTTSRQADVGWCWEFLQSPGVWGTCWDHPIVPDPAAWEMERKKHMQEGVVFPPQPALLLPFPKGMPVCCYLCKPEWGLCCSLFSAEPKVDGELVQTGDVRVCGSRQLLWHLYSSSPCALCLSIHREKKTKQKTANHRKCKFITKGVINLFSFYFSFSNILLISLIPIPDLVTELEVCTLFKPKYRSYFSL